MDIFKSSDLSKQDKYGLNLARYIAMFNSSQNLNLTSKQLWKLKQENNRPKTSFATALQKIRNTLGLAEKPDENSPEISTKSSRNP